jgi:hypothetical protein
MDESKTSAPVKDQPHAFESGPEVPPAFPSTGDIMQETLVTESATNCALCGSPRGAQIHVAGKSEADAESPKWG